MLLPAAIVHAFKPVQFHRTPVITGRQLLHVAELANAELARVERYQHLRVTIQTYGWPLVNDSRGFHLMEETLRSIQKNRFYVDTW